MRAFEIEFSDTALEHRPQHAAVLGRIFTTWSLVEGAVSSILGNLMHSNHRAAIALLGQFRTNKARLAAVKKVAAEMIAEQELPSFIDLMGRVAKHANIRNDIAHGVWGTRQDRPDAVFRLPLQDYSNLIIELVPAAKSGKSPLPIVQNLLAKAEIFTLDRLLAIESEGRSLLHDLWDDLNKMTLASLDS